MKKKPLIIFGAGGLGREIKTLVDELPEWTLIGFCDDGVVTGERIMEVPVLGGQSYLLDKRDEVNVVVALGSPLMKYNVVKNLSVSALIKFPSLIHPRAVLGDVKTIFIGIGSIITAGCILTTSIAVGNHVLLNLNSTIGHDSTIGDYSALMPGVNIAGHVTIGNNVLIGSGANVLSSIHIGAGAIVGSGAVVTKDVADGLTVVGVPASVLVKS